jgi:hypothetical protein
MLEISSVRIHDAPMAKAKPKVGRPPRAGKAADDRFEIRLTAAERKAWTAAAEQEGLTLADWLRAAAELAVARGSTR